MLIERETRVSGHHGASLSHWWSWSAVSCRFPRGGASRVWRIAVPQILAPIATYVGVAAGNVAIAVEGATAAAGAVYSAAYAITYYGSAIFPAEQGRFRAVAARQDWRDGRHGSLRVPIATARPASSTARSAWWRPHDPGRELWQQWRNVPHECLQSPRMRSTCFRALHRPGPRCRLLRQFAPWATA